jgi:hypothetical protein
MKRMVTGRSDCYRVIERALTLNRLCARVGENGNSVCVAAIPWTHKRRGPYDALDRCSTLAVAKWSAKSTVVERKEIDPVSSQDGTVTRSHSYSRTGAYTVKLTVTDGSGATATASAQTAIAVYNPGVRSGGSSSQPKATPFPEASPTPTLMPAPGTNTTDETTATVPTTVPETALPSGHHAKSGAYPGVALLPGIGSASGDAETIIIFF